MFFQNKVSLENSKQDFFALKTGGGIACLIRNNNNSTSNLYKKSGGNALTY